MKNFYDVIPKLNALLIVSGFVLGGYLLFAMSRPYQVGSLAGRAPDTTQLNPDKQLSGVPQFSVEAFRKSQLFRSSGKKAASQEAKSFTLLGVSMGEKKIAILRDTKTKKDYYCTEGDVAADYKVKEISREKVVLEYEGELLEITR
ncbi:MAG TPA: hypothetical protein PLJ26_05050 [Candidatus Omnitrophota bacterium]|nr:hypothetical protein [Candidatus Omnitrophota bacterium]HQJ15834.1 hypothetical protein [Candidatus Omnitrophota bacterium]